MIGHLVSARYALDLQEDTILWTDADPAWVTGTVYGAFAPWLCGVTSIVQGDPFSASTFYWTLEKHRVNVLYTTPKNIRRLMDAGENLAERYDFSQLSHIATVGAPLDPELFYWVMKYLKLSPHDTWWMTETGMICIANFRSMDIKPGSMGKPMPGVETAVVDETGEPLPALTMGELSLKTGLPALMKCIWRDKIRYEEYFLPQGWFLTGDMVIRDEDGYFYHQGRTDDLIKVGGDKVVGPYEIEQVISRHPAVREAAIIAKRVVSTGVPRLKAFVTLNRGFTPSARLNQEIKALVDANYSFEIVLREIAFLEELPKTRSGKLLRRVLRARELGMPAGDPLKMKD
jgi:acetyl-CoA synthetase